MKFTIRKELFQNWKNTKEFRNNFSIIWWKQKIRSIDKSGFSNPGKSLLKLKRKRTEFKFMLPIQWTESKSEICMNLGELWVIKDF